RYLRCCQSEPAALLSGVRGSLSGRPGGPGTADHSLGKRAARPSEEARYRGGGARLRDTSHIGRSALPRSDARSERPTARLVLPGEARNREQRARGAGAILDAPGLAVAVVD